MSIVRIVGNAGKGEAVMGTKPLPPKQGAVIELLSALFMRNRDILYLYMISLWEIKVGL